MSTCHFCKQEFTNSQAVRAHLKACSAYLGRPSRQDDLPSADVETPLGNDAIRSIPVVSDFDPVRQIRQQVAAEQLRLKLREVQQAHGELDAREAARQQGLKQRNAQEAEAASATQKEHERSLARATALAREQAAAEEVKARHKAKRRDTIQAVKRKVVEQYGPAYHWQGELKAQILKAVEIELSPLPVEELPQEELEQIAAGVRDRLATHAAQAQNQVLALAQQRQRLQTDGQDYGRRELLQCEGVDVFERFRIEARIQQELQQVTGDESTLEIRAWVDEILDDEGLGLSDE